MMMRKDAHLVNENGSMDIYFGPKFQEKYQSNWISTMDKRPYVWLRLYGPDNAFWDKSLDPRWGHVGKQVIEDRGPLGGERQKTFDDEVLQVSLDWMKRMHSANKPFFLWFNPSRVHQEIHVSDEWLGKSGHSRYADGLLHLDWLVGEVLKSLDQMGISDNTIVLFTSDNGINLSHWPSAGTAAFRGEKGLTWDGGFRVPMLVRWPGKIPAGKYSGELFTAEDWLPTLLAATGDSNAKQTLLKGTTVDGRRYKVHLDGYNQMDVLTQKGKSKRREFFFYGENDLNAIRVDYWKVHLATKEGWLEPLQRLPGGIVVDIKLDPFERTPDTPGYFLWVKEKTWMMPMLLPPLKAFAKSMKEFPPRHKGTGIGASAILQMIETEND